MKRGFGGIIIMAVAFVVIPVVLFAGSDTSYDDALRCYSSGKYEQAVKYLAEYIQKKPDPAAYYLLGYSLYELRRFAEADEYFRQAYLIDPTFSPEQIGVSKKYPPLETKAAKKHPEKHKHAATRRKAVSSESKGAEQGKQAQTPEKQTGKDMQQKQPAAQKVSPQKTPPPAAQSEPKEGEQQK